MPLENQLVYRRKIVQSKPSKEVTLFVRIDVLCFVWIHFPALCQKVMTVDKKRHEISPSRVLVYDRILVVFDVVDT